MKRSMPRLILLLAVFIPRLVTAQISVGPSGVGPLTFSTNPIVTEFSTTVLIGSDRTFLGPAVLDAAVSGIDISTYSPAFRQLPVTITFPPSTASQGFRYNTNNTGFIQTRPHSDGTNAANVLLASFRNDSGTNRSALVISYDQSLGGTLPNTGSDEIPGLRVFYSFSGAADSWQPIASLSGTEAQGSQSAVLSLGLWNVGAPLFVIWADDNDDGDTDPSYTIDNLRINLQQPAPVIVTSPWNATNLVGRSVRIEVVAEGIGLAYQWYKVGAGPINPAVNPSAETSTLVITNAQLNDTGDYFAIVSSLFGETQSNSGHVQINPDIFPPRLLSAQPSILGVNFFELRVDEPLCLDQPACGANAACTFNWQIVPVAGVAEGADLNVAEVQVNGTNLLLRTTAPYQMGTQYRVKVVGYCDGGINDVYGNQLLSGDPASILDSFPGLVFTATLDAELHSNAGAPTPLGQAQTVKVDNDDAGIARALLGFENLIGSGPGQIPSGSQIVSATLQVTQLDPGNTVNFHRMLVPWDEATVTWNSLIDGVTNDGAEATRGVEATSPVSSANGPVLIDVTSSVQAWANGAPNFGWAILSTGPDGWSWASAESATPPAMSVAYQLCHCAGPIIITAQPPPNLTVVEGSAFNLSVGLSNVFAPSYQWTKNGTAIPFAIGPTYSISSAVLGSGHSGSYRLQVAQAGVTITSAVSVVNVVPDTNRPVVSWVYVAESFSGFTMGFSKPMDRFLAETEANYSITPSPGFFVAELSADGRTVSLRSDPPMVGNYSLRIQGLTDTRASANVLEPNPTIVALTFVDTFDSWGSTWSYNTNSQDATLASTPWYSPAFDVSSWPVGPAVFGTETSAAIVALFPRPITTPLPPNTNTPPEMVTFYFRKEIELPAIPAGLTYALKHFIDDGAVFWLDGVEIGRLNMTNPPPVLYSHRSSSSGEASLLSFPFTTSPGTHTLAVEVHQGGPTTSSDMVFGVQIIAISTNSPPLKISRSGTNAVVRWSADSSWVLQRANAVGGPFAAVWPTSGFGVHTNVTSGNATNLFFRLQFQPER